MREANEAIAKSQPSARPIDLSEIQMSESTAVRLFTMFSSFTLRWGQRQRLYFDAYRSGQIGLAEYTRHTVYEWFLPILVMNAIPMFMAWLSQINIL